MERGIKCDESKRVRKIGGITCKNKHQFPVEKGSVLLNWLVCRSLWEVKGLEDT